MIFQNNPKVSPDYHYLIIIFYSRYAPVHVRHLTGYTQVSECKRSLSEQSSVMFSQRLVHTHDIIFISLHGHKTPEAALLSNAHVESAALF